MMSMVCLFGNPFPQNFKEVSDQSSLLNTGTLLSASPVKICLYLYTQFVDGNFCLLILRAVTEC